MRAIDRAGFFRARAMEWTLRKLPSGDPIIRVTFECDAVKDGQDWRPITPGVVNGDWFVVKRTGAPNEKVVEMLCVQLGWGGSFTEVVGSPPNGEPLQIEVDGREHNGKTYYQAQWIKPLGAGGAGDMDPVEAVELDKKLNLAGMAKKFARPSKAQPSSDVPF